MNTKEKVFIITGASSGIGAELARQLAIKGARVVCAARTIEKLERSVSPLRRNSGKLIILDGRANKRRWGRSIMKSIEPSKQINYMLPFD